MLRKCVLVGLVTALFLLSISFIILTAQYAKEGKTAIHHENNVSVLIKEKSERRVLAALGG